MEMDTKFNEYFTPRYIKLLYISWSPYIRKHKTHKQAAWYLFMCRFTHFVQHYKIFKNLCDIIQGVYISSHLLNVKPSLKQLRDTVGCDGLVLLCFFGQISQSVSTLFLFQINVTGATRWGQGWRVYCGWIHVLL